MTRHFESLTLLDALAVETVDGLVHNDKHTSPSFVVFCQVFLGGIEDIIDEAEGVVELLRTAHLEARAGSVGRGLGLEDFAACVGHLGIAAARHDGQ